MKRIKNYLNNHLFLVIILAICLLSVIICLAIGLDNLDARYWFYTVSIVGTVTLLLSVIDLVKNAERYD